MGEATNALKALMSHMEKLDTGLVIAWPNVAHDEIPAYLQVSITPNGSILEGYKSNTVQGIMQVAIIQASGIGIIHINEIADQIIDHFKGQRLFEGNTVVEIYKNPTAGATVVNDGYSFTPVTIEYRYH